jgi:hypothetical protein
MIRNPRALGSWVGTNSFATRHEVHLIMHPLPSPREPFWILTETIKRTVPRFLTQYTP